MKKLFKFISFKLRERKNKKTIQSFAKKIKDGHYLLIEELDLLNAKVGPGWWRMIQKELL